MRTKLFMYLLLAGLAISFKSVAQADKVYLHNGKVVTGSVVKVAEYTVIYKYEGEDAEQVAGKYAVHKIIYKSGREEVITDKIEVNSKDDWEKVVVLEDKSQIAGLNKVAEVKGKTALINYHTAATGDRKALKRLKEETASLGCAFVLITAEKETNYTGGGTKGWGNTQEQKKGLAYRY
ncbi:MAG: hypothetical protein JNK08_07270 [Sediminibacterium sp.]|nr:hypothetical protein [Sediminibacterium sp.]